MIIGYNYDNTARIAGIFYYNKLFKYHYGLNHENI